MINKIKDDKHSESGNDTKPIVLCCALFIRDMMSALWAWVSIWNIDIQKLERRKRFMDDALDDKRKKGLPARIWYAAYRCRGIA